MGKLLQKISIDWFKASSTGSKALTHIIIILGFICFESCQKISNLRESTKVLHQIFVGICA